MEGGRPEAIAPSGDSVARIGVVVPVHDEERTLRECLDGLLAAARGVPAPVDVVIVLDDCADESAKVAAEFAEAAVDVLTVHALSIEARCVGAARAAGMANLMARHGPRGTWLATTDADSVVPGHWLAAQLRHVEAGARVVAGTVSVTDWSPWGEAVARRANRAYRVGPHRHVHGANLSFQAEAYRAVGGFRAVRHDEDVALVEALRANGESIAWATDLAVTTSARRNGRAPNGFAGYLASVEASTARHLESSRSPAI